MLTLKATSTYTLSSPPADIQQMPDQAGIYVLGLLIVACFSKRYRRKVAEMYRNVRARCRKR